MDDVFTQPGLKLMNHVVAGYPNSADSLAYVKAMEAAGTDVIEIQIPFSDPMADGLTIVKANHTALTKGMTLAKFWEWLQQVRKETKLPLLLMTYYNIPYRMGLEKFFSLAVEHDISGLIVPDIPFDDQTENYLTRMNPYPLHAIPVISPSVGESRLQKIQDLGSGMIYTTLKVGVTGSTKPNTQHGLDFLQIVKKYFSLPIAAGFGINTPDQVAALNERADMAVIGSRIIQIINEHPNREEAMSAISNFIKACKA